MIHKQFLIGMQQLMHQHNLFGIPIHEALLVDFDKSKILACLDKLFVLDYPQHQLECNDSKSTYNLTNEDGGYLHRRPEFASLVEFVETEADKYWHEYGLDTWYQPQIKMMWANVHHKGSFTSTHMHSGSPIVGSFYLKFPKNSGNIFFENPLEYHVCHEPRKVLLPYVHPIEENLLCMFPGWLKHGTEVNESDEDRIVIAFNFEAINRKPITYSFE